MIAYPFWQIWKSRNLWTFSGVYVSPFEVYNKAESSFFEYAHSSTHIPHLRSSKSSPMTFSWTPPTEGWIKINCDASIDVVSGSVGAAVVMCDESSCMVGGDSKLFQSSSVDCTEALPLRLGLKLAFKYNLHYVCFESDNKCLIDILVKKSVLLVFCLYRGRHSS
ncbi:hypothetical protein V6N11_054756 [Hibiscus sabdariffa]|uniref:RNase H type-1 domain-containing protein n=1 Tax=Hibiscus sabdariffa TaxID=183260 RepID=A0ABR2S4W3_9ROSI